MSTLELILFTVLIAAIGYVAALMTVHRKVSGIEERMHKALYYAADKQLKLNEVQRDLNDRTSELTLAHILNDEKDVAIKSITAAHQYLYSTYRGQKPVVTDRMVTTAQATSLAELVNLQPECH